MIADSEAEAREFSLGRGLEASEVVEADLAARPSETLLMRVPAAPVEAPSAARRRLRLALLGVGIALWLIATFLFAIKAREHLGRGRPPVQQLP